MKKVFIVAGELSGDKLGAWYVKKRWQKNKNSEVREQVSLEAVGGDFLKSCDVKLYERFEKLNVVGLVEIARRLFFILGFLRKLARYIIENNFDEVVLIDFPGFNMRLARLLKRRNARMKITYVSPPQMWCWGAWRLKALKKYSDQIIVLYPFEVDWYKKRGVRVYYLGCPTYDRVRFFCDTKSDNVCCDKRTHQKNKIAVMLGSRSSEIKTLFPVFVSVMKKFVQKYPDVLFVLPIAESLSKQKIEGKIKDVGLDRYVTFVYDEKEKLGAINQSCLALTKPGTVTLELALLGVPAVVLFKASWLTYVLARLVVKVPYMSLPNLFLDKLVYEEFLQGDCDPDKIFKHAEKLYKDFLVSTSTETNSCEYTHVSQDLVRLKKQFISAQK